MLTRTDHGYYERQKKLARTTSFSKSYVGPAHPAACPHGPLDDSDSPSLADRTGSWGPARGQADQQRGGQHRGQAGQQRGQGASIADELLVVMQKIEDEGGKLIKMGNGQYASEIKAEKGKKGSGQNLLCSVEHRYPAGALGFFFSVESVGSKPNAPKSAAGPPRDQIAPLHLP